MTKLLLSTEPHFPFSPSSSNSQITTTSYLKKTCIRKANSFKPSFEFSLIQSLCHKNIIKAYILDTPKSFIMEFCQLGDLKPKKPLVSIELIQTFKQMCEAVQYIHSLNICHLDIKLENFVKDENGVIKLIDFEAAQNSMKLVKLEKGTDIYNAPERKFGDYDGKKADIFSLGVCLVGLMAGFVPATRDRQAFVLGQSYEGDVEGFWDKIEAVVMKRWKEFEGFDALGCELAAAMVDVQPGKRPCIDEVLGNEFFQL